MQRHVEGCVERFRPPSRTSPFYSLRRYLSWECGRVFHSLSDRVPLPFLVLASHGVLRHLLLACCEHFTKQRRSKAHGLCSECDEITHPHSVQSSSSAASTGVKVKGQKDRLSWLRGLGRHECRQHKPLARWSRCNHAGFLLGELAGAKVKAS